LAHHPIGVEDAPAAQQGLGGTPQPLDEPVVLVSVHLEEQILHVVITGVEGSAGIAGRPAHFLDTEPRPAAVPDEFIGGLDQTGPGVAAPAGFPRLCDLHDKLSFKLDTFRIGCISY
jgi:hypothetical protein